MIVKFANICDEAGCTARSDEYTHWPVCRECEGDFCPRHIWPGTLRDGDNDLPQTCQCRACAMAEQDDCA